MFSSTVVNVAIAASVAVAVLPAVVRTVQQYSVTRGKIPGVTKTFISDRNPNKIKHQTPHM